MIRYSIVPESPAAHRFEVSLQLPASKGNAFELHMPAWIRGSYMVRDFARHILSLKGVCQGATVDLEKLDKQTWKLIAPCDGTLVVSYQVYAWDLSVRGAHLDVTHGYFNGPCVFLGVAGKDQEPCEVIIKRPAGERYTQWTLATTLPARHVDNQGFGRYVADNYEALLDHPVEMGLFQEAAFEVGGVPHRFVANTNQSFDLQRICADLKKICQTEVDLFGELPLSQYMFLLWVVGSGYGGLEHRDSTSLMIGRDSLPFKGMQKISSGYRRLLGLCSHEYFHLWNVKRIRPEVFNQQGTAREVHTRQLWVFEGVTSYYDELLLLRSGVIETKDYFEMLAEAVTRLHRAPGRFRQTLEESSFDAWTKFYKQDENAPNAIVSYYLKGALVALLLDLAIRLRSEGRLSLDRVMREFWHRFGKTDTGVTESAFEQLVEEVTGLNFSSEFDLWLRTTDELPLAEAFKEFGVELHLLPAKSHSDLGGVVDARPEIEGGKPVLGAKLEPRPSGLLLLQVFDGGAAQAAGLSAGDEIVAVDGLRMEQPALEAYLSQQPAESLVHVHVFRGDELMTFKVAPLPAPADTCWFFLSEDIDAAHLQRRTEWLSGHVDRG